MSVDVRWISMYIPDCKWMGSLKGSNYVYCDSVVHLHLYL